MELMRFPFEIREAILKLVVFTDTTEPPKDAVTLTKELRKEGLQEDAENGRDYEILTAGNYSFLPPIEGGIGSLPVFYRTATCKNPALPLLLVSRQVHDETQRVLDDTVDHTSSKADVMFIKNVGLWTTWLSAPRSSSHVETMNAQFRSFNAPETLDSTFFNGHMWSVGCGGPPLGVWGFYDLLVGFLEGIIGPFPRRKEIGGPASYGSGRRGANLRITVGRLVLDCLSTVEENILPLNFTAGGSSSFLSARHLDPALPEPKRAALALADFLVEMLEILMRPDRYIVDMSKLLLERVREISVQVDGEPYRHLTIQTSSRACNE